MSNATKKEVNWVAVLLVPLLLVVVGVWATSLINRQEQSEAERLDVWSDTVTAILAVDHVTPKTTNELSARIQQCSEHVHTQGQVDLFSRLQQQVNAVHRLLMKHGEGTVVNKAFSDVKKSARAISESLRTRRNQ